MSAGKSYKFHGSTIAVITAIGAESPSLQISGITKANPPVVSVTAHGLSDGDVVRLSDIVGMTELNGAVAIVDVLTSGTFALLNMDSTFYGAYVSGGEVEEAAFSNFCELTNYNRQGGSSADIDATSLCSVAKEYDIDLPDFGTTQLDYKFAPQTAIQRAVADYYSGDEAGNLTAIKVTLPNSGGIMVQLGRIQVQSEQAGNGTIWTASMTFRNTGPRVDFAA